jgi:hypothetical protein
MTHVNLDAQPEAVRQFVLTLAVPPDGTVLELGGRPVARLLPPLPPVNGPADDAEWTDAKNRRRCELIDREIDGTLTPEQAQELAILQRQMLHYRHRVAPLPLEDARRLHQELLARTDRDR